MALPLHAAPFSAQYVIGKQVKGGHYGKLPILTHLDVDTNVAHTTQFRRCYIDSKSLLSGDFAHLPIFA